jgi:nucleoside-diphosphate-sugar epimerase
VRLLITGVTGFTGSHIAKLAIEAGHHVVGTCRDKEHAQWLYGVLPDARRSLTLAQVDLHHFANPSLFHESVEGCDAVIHPAAIVRMCADDPMKEIYQPTVVGTKRLMESCIKYNVPRMVLTSSVYALGTYPKTGRIFDESMVASDATLRDAPYPFVKAAQERVARELGAEHGVAVTSLHPTFICGPIMSRNAVSKSMQLFQRLIDGKMPLTPRFHYTYIDVRDLARAHLMCLEPRHDNERFVIGNPEATFWLLEVAEQIRRIHPDLSDRLPKGNCWDIAVYLAAIFEDEVSWKFLSGSLGQMMQVDASKSITALGMNYTSWSKTIDDTVASLLGTPKISLADR